GVPSIPSLSSISGQSMAMTPYMGGGGGDPIGQWSAEFARKSEELKAYDKDEVHNLVRKAKAEGEKQSLLDATDTIVRVLRGVKRSYETSAHSSVLLPIFDRSIVLFGAEQLRSMQKQQKE